MILICVCLTVCGCVFVQLLCIKVSIDSLSIIQEQEPQEADVDDLHPPSWLHPAPSSSSVTKIFSEGVVECTQGFGTVQVSGLPQDFQEQQAGGGKQKPRNLKKGLYYEVDLITGGLMQVGSGDGVLC